METIKKTRTITEVTTGKSFHSILMGAFYCDLESCYGVIPKIGDKLTVYTTEDDFYHIQGMDLNGKKIYWKTQEQLRQENLRRWTDEELLERQEQKKKRLKENAQYRDEKYNLLPEYFKKYIIDSRINAEKTFGIHNESLILFCCEQAIIIAGFCKTKEAVSMFSQHKYEDRLKQIPELSDGHIDISLNMSCILAYSYLSTTN